MKVFKDLEFEVSMFGGIKARTTFDNGIGLSVIAGANAYSTPREALPTPDLFEKFEVAVFAPNGDFTREFFPPDHNDDVMGWQERGQINALMLLIQSKK